MEYYNFSENPFFADAPGLGGYTFKVHIINKLSKNYDIVLWADSSIRILKPMSLNLIAGCEHNQPWPIVAFTKDSTLKYLNMTRKEAQGVEGFAANIFIFNFANIIARSLLNEWVDCALHKECMVSVPILPSDLEGFHWKHPKSDISFIGCHRYDQAALKLPSY